jgi:hypothetical protein
MWLTIVSITLIAAVVFAGLALILHWRDFAQRADGQE